MERPTKMNSPTLPRPLRGEIREKKKKKKHLLSFAIRKLSRCTDLDSNGRQRQEVTNLLRILIPKGRTKAD